MFQKFLSLFTRRNAAKRSIKMPEPPSLVDEAFNRWADRTQPFPTRTPHSRIPELIAAGRADASIAVELGVEIAAVRTYRDIIGAKGRETARRRAAEARVPAMLARGGLDEDIAAELRLPLLTVQNIRTDINNERRRRALWDDCQRRLTPAVFQPRQADATSRSDSDALLPLSAALTASLFMNQSHAAPCPAPAPDVSSGGGDFSGGGASGCY